MKYIYPIFLVVVFQLSQISASEIVLHRTWLDIHGLLKEASRQSGHEIICNISLPGAKKQFYECKVSLDAIIEAAKGYLQNHALIPVDVHRGEHRTYIVRKGESPKILPKPAPKPVPPPSTATKKPKTPTPPPAPLPKKVKQPKVMAKQPASVLDKLKAQQKHISKHLSGHTIDLMAFGRRWLKPTPHDPVIDHPTSFANRYAKLSPIPPKPFFTQWSLPGHRKKHSPRKRLNLKSFFNSMADKILPGGIKWKRPNVKKQMDQFFHPQSAQTVEPRVSPMLKLKPVQKPVEPVKTKVEPVSTKKETLPASKLQLELLDLNPSKQ